MISNSRFQDSSATWRSPIVYAIWQRRRLSAPAQLALAWLLTRDNVVPILAPAMSNDWRKTSVPSAFQLTRDELDEIDRRSPKGAVAGERYHASGAALLNG